MICTICNFGIYSSQKIVVISYPLEAINNDGNYNIFPDFIDNQKIYHYQCFSSFLPELREGLEIENSLYQALKEIGDKVSRKEIREFISEQEEKDLHNLIVIWLSKRNVFDQKL